MKLKKILFLIVFIACGAGQGDVEVTENTSSNSDEPTTTTEQQKENDDSISTTTTTEEVNEESEDYSSENVISIGEIVTDTSCLLYTSPSPRDRTRSRMPSSA